MVQCGAQLMKVDKAPMLKLNNKWHYFKIVGNVEVWLRKTAWYNFFLINFTQIFELSVNQETLDKKDLSVVFARMPVNTVDRVCQILFPFSTEASWQKTVSPVSTVIWSSTHFRPGSVKKIKDFKLGQEMNIKKNLNLNKIN